MKKESVMGMSKRSLKSIQGMVSIDRVTKPMKGRTFFFIQESPVSQAGIAQDGQQEESQTIGDSDSRNNDSKVSEHFSRLIDMPPAEGACYVASLKP